MKVVCYWLSIISVIGVMSCQSATTLFWRSYHHPTYQFTFKYPRSWQLQEGGQFGTQIIIRASQPDILFTPNFNLVISQRDMSRSLDQLVELAKKQLSQVLTDYAVLAEAKTAMGNREGIEIRGHYKARNDWRVVRTFIALTDEFQYTGTFTSRKDSEGNHAKTVNRMLMTFYLPK